jgi:uncharacterized protein with PQ loop repeat
MIGHPILTMAIGLVASTLSLSMTMPQAMRIWRDRSATGVSTVTWMLFCVTFSQWIGYTLREGIWIAFAGNVLALITAISTLVGIHRANPRRHDLSFGVLLFAAIGSAMLIGHNAPLGVVIVMQFAAVLVRMPQVFASFRTWRTRRHSEVSRTAWWLGLASAGAWTIYGITLPDLAIAAVSPTFMVTSALVLAFEYLSLSGVQGGRVKRLA